MTGVKTSLTLTVTRITAILSNKVLDHSAAMKNQNIYYDWESVKANEIGKSSRQIERVLNIPQPLLSN